MKALMLLAALAGGSPASAAMPADATQDPLMRQILAKTLQPNGGVTAAVRVKGATKGIELRLQEPPALPAAAEGLAGKPPARAARKPARRAGEQLDVLKAAGEKASFDKSRK